MAVTMHNMQLQVESAALGRRSAYGEVAERPPAGLGSDTDTRRLKKASIKSARIGWQPGRKRLILCECHDRHSQLNYSSHARRIWASNCDEACARQLISCA